MTTSDDATAGKAVTETVTAVDDPPRRRWRDGAGRWPTVSVRVRVVASVVAMSLLGLMLTQGVSFLVQYRAIDDQAEDALAQEVAEIRALAEDGVDPATGEPFTSVERLMRVALQGNVPDRNETYLTVIDGEPFEFDGGERFVELEREPALLAAVAEARLSPSIVLRDIETSAGTARTAIIPVSATGDGAEGAYVIAYAVDLERADLARVTQLFVVIALGALLLVGVVAWVVAGRLLRPLRTLREATQRISDTDLTERIPVRGNDDVSELTRTYNAMLDRLQDAMDSQRRFLDDAGHELRTPLTIVRGHLEVLDPDDPGDVAEARVLVLDEIDRMSRLVDDLILLSKARRPDFLIVDEIDLLPFTDMVAEKIQPLGDRRWGVEARGDARFVADAQRLTQALVQLADNAVKFSAPGSAVLLGSAADDDEVRLWVADDGVGIEAADLPQVFDRFGRAESGRGVDGSGLGLSIVSAIARAHGGRVDVDSVPGVGSRFTVIVPRRPLDDHDDADATPADVAPDGRDDEDWFVSTEPLVTEVLSTDKLSRTGTRE